MATHALQCLDAIDHPLKADARGAGLFFGIEFVTDADMTPATDFTVQLVETMRRKGVLLNKIGMGGNILKMRPPLSITIDQMDLARATLEQALAETPIP